MVGRIKFGRGDIVVVNLDPAAGREQRGMRPAFVLSNAIFNALGLVMAAQHTGRALYVAIRCASQNTPVAL